jgi:hypothetical protein
MTFSHYRAHATTLYKSQGILQLQDNIFTQMAKFMYDYHNNNLPCVFNNYFMCGYPVIRYQVTWILTYRPRGQPIYSQYVTWT